MTESGFAHSYWWVEVMPVAANNSLLTNEGAQVGKH